MPHPAVARLRELLPPPADGGDTADWPTIEQTKHLASPSDYREFVELYGGGETNGYLSVSTPSIPGSAYGDLLEEDNSTLLDRDVEELDVLLKGSPLPALLPFAESASSDVVFWLREGHPDDWRVAVFRRQAPHGTKRWTVFSGGMASFCAAVFTGEVDPLSERISVGGLREFVSWREA